MIDLVHKKFKDYTPYINGHDKMNKFSVFIPLVKNELNETCILFQVRAKTLRNQPSEISFPGGRIENDETPDDASIRETCEELGFDKSNINLISELDLFVNYSNMIIHSFVGEIKNLDLININKDEVESVFLVPLKYLLETTPNYYTSSVEVIPSDDFPFELVPNKHDYKFKTSSYDIVFYKYNDYVIWGITAKILEDFIEFLKN